jgi:hypothetical protein
MPLVAAVALAVVLLGAVLLVRGGPTGSDGGSAAGPAASAPEGWRLTSYRDVVVAVPEEWGYDYAPGSDWCADTGGDRVPDGPYVDVSGSYDVVLSIGCFRERPARYDVTHLEFSDPETQEEGAEPERAGWSSLSRRVGAAVVTVWFDPAHEAVARQVLDSAQVADVDPNGCPATSPIQAGHFARPQDPFRVEDVTAVDTISVCQYALTGTDVPGLLASRQLTGAAADDVLTAIQEAPLGGGPDQPQQCSGAVYGDTALVLRLASGDVVREVYVYMESCRGNGFDDGTTRRELTAEACRPLWQLPVRLISGHSQSFARCHD